jgi:hypothetical protein
MIRQRVFLNFRISGILPRPKQVRQTSTSSGRRHASAIGLEHAFRCASSGAHVSRRFPFRSGCAWGGFARPPHIQDAESGRIHHNLYIDKYISPGCNTSASCSLEPRCGLTSPEEYLVLRLKSLVEQVSLDMGSRNED